ncbi:SDR family oxidoreductase [Dactylosporangium matsuzakiense]|uniref:SDR family oxidoreductase n=1 Tax=Dactylosporangium matsuzakiense TaxID=53360 RepID=UPI0021C36CA4|nr:NAD(P)H-binding protein [Dactylosporangium matsuzakiense]UWZ47617.1 NAD(P)H-binding protein [Dactylosporangium matsuzakiense]
MTTPIVVTGGTGTLGRLLLPHLLDAGRSVRVLTRRQPAGPAPSGSASSGLMSSNSGLSGSAPSGAASVGPASAGRPAEVEYAIGDLETGTGVVEALAEADTVVHCAGSAKGDDVKAAHLVGAAVRAGVKHIVYISVVGAERVPVRSAVDRAAFGYFGAKRAAEVCVAESGIPFTTLRASQFHELTLATVRQLAKLPVVPVPAGVRFQPIDGAEVARRLAELAFGDPAGLVPDVAGPRVYGFDELARSYLHAAGKRRPILRVPMGGGAYRAIRAGANLAPDRAVGVRTWEQYLAANR